MLVRLLAASILVACMAFGGPARADEAPPPSYYSCSGKAVGAVCEADEGPGTCVASTCSRLDYSQGTPPRTIQSDCLKCRKGSAAPAAPPVTSTVDPPPAAPPVTSKVEPAPAAPPVTSRVDPPPAAATPGPGPAQSGCQIEGAPGGESLVLLLLATIRRRRGARREAWGPGEG